MGSKLFLFLENQVVHFPKFVLQFGGDCGTRSRHCVFVNLGERQLIKREMDFETKLRALLGEYGYSLKDVISLLEPQAGRRAAAAQLQSSTRKPREVKVYKNPESGEVVQTKGGNHKVLKEWKAKYGSEKVESWLTK